MNSPLPPCLRRLAFGSCLGAALASISAPVAAETVGSAEDHFAEPEQAFDCVIMPHAVVDVSSGVSGRLEAIRVERGDRVHKDELLAQLESGVERANTELARARAAIDTEIHLMRARLDYDERKKERTDVLYQRSVITPQQKDEVDRDASLAKWQLRHAREKRHLAELELNRAEELLKLRYVRSPIDGVVVERFKWAGEFVEEEPILRVAQLDPLRVEVIVPVETYDRVRRDLRAEVVPETEPQSPRPARVTLVDPMADPASGTLRVRLELPNPQQRLLAGIRCKATFAWFEAGEEAGPGEQDATARAPAADLPALDAAALDAARTDAVAADPPVPNIVTPDTPAPDAVALHAPPADAPAADVPTRRDAMLDDAQTPGPGIDAEPTRLLASDASWEAEARPAADAPLAPAALPRPRAKPDSTAAVAGGEVSWGEARVVSAAPESVNPADARPAACRSVGPLEDGERAARIAESLSRGGSFLATAREATASLPNGYIVLAGSGEEDADALARRLRERGVSDLLVMGYGAYDGLLSLGVFEHLESAERRHRSLSELGFKTRIEQRIQSRAVWWVDITPGPVDPGPGALASALAALEPEPSLEAVECASRTPAAGGAVAFGG